MAKPGSKRYKDIPLKMVGGTNFGRYSKISAEQTWNMIVVPNDRNWMVPFAGYNNVATIAPNGVGRAIFTSTVTKKLCAIINNNFYSADASLVPAIASGVLATVSSNVFMTEDNFGNIFFTDSVNLYYWTAATNTITTVAFTLANGWSYQPSPGYLTYQNGRIIFADLSTNLWYLSGTGSGPTGTTYFANSSQTQGALQTKPDYAQACVRFPGKGNLLLVFGKIVTEQWQDVGSQLFPYQRSISSNIDYGCVNPGTIDENEDIVCWVAGNEKSGLFIAYSDGKGIKKISNDGIDYQLANLTDPTNCYGFLFRQDGHLIYVATWPTDGLSYAYDFNTNMFFTLSDEQLHAYIAKDVCLFNGNYYFVSIRDGNIYQMSSNIYTYNYGNGIVYDSPRIRIPPHIFMDDESRFVAGYSGFTIEQGQFDYDYRDTRFILGDGSQVTENAIGTQKPFPMQQAIGGGYNYRTNVPGIDLCLSKDGAVNYGSNVRINMRPQGKRQNRVMWRRLGAANYLTQQFRFYGMSRFVLTDGVTGVYQ